MPYFEVYATKLLPYLLGFSHIDNIVKDVIAYSFFNDLNCSFHYYLIFFDLFFYSHKATESSHGLTSMKSHTSFLMNMVFIKSDYWSQFTKSLSFCWRKLLKVLSVFLSVMVSEGTKSFMPKKKFVFFMIFFL